ncbi:MAG: DNA-directed RNA polymerase subunit alpha [Chloroherpetonaceae bacterium]|nr:DNA-directed RNA polymerase subunit alpha [Chthonomonadaceae bacterium]MDW8207971.1 DNA-directed RNA polymerase subunit alpha [Chloroherpetonaceae bacterium]
MELPKIQTLESNSEYGKFVVEPLERGYGVTLGNSLRRVLLSSIPGAAITYVKIDKVLHEFSTIPGVKEDTTELLLNLKDLNIKVERNGGDYRHEPKTLRLDVKGSGRVTGADIVCPEDVQIVNPEAYIATISDEDATLRIDMTVETNKGYVPPERLERRNQIGIGVIPMGAAFTPVRKVNYTVEATRVKSDTSLERLVLEVWTNGTITPENAIGEAARILMQYFSLFAGNLSADGMLASLTQEEEAPVENAPNVRIEELDFSVRTYNCLKKANILTIPELIQYTENDLMQIRNFGKKSLEEVREKLQQLGLTLKGGSTVNLESAEEGSDSEG